VDVELAALTERERYKIMAGLVVPRPIAWVTSLDEAGTVNLAPYSFFQVMATVDCHIGLGISNHEDGRRKDTLAAIQATGEFVVNLCTVDFAETVDGSSAEFPPGYSEATHLGVELTDSKSVRVPRVAAAPASLECRLVQIMPMGSSEWWVVGQVTHATIKDTIMDARMHVDYQAYRPLGRLVATKYVDTREIFNVTGTRMLEPLAGTADS
jgi:flavin reductase (DIM6/NTAB) family NADH-FMN oxidoreductase RutF